jgi:fructokinase
VFVVAGESLVDIVRSGDSADEYAAGGSPLNVAVGLARLGVTTTLVTDFGDDELGSMLADHLAASGVAVAPASVVTGRRTSSAAALLDHAGAATYDFDLHWDPVPTELPADASGLHVGSLGALLEPGASVVEALLLEAVRRGLPVSYDPNVRPFFVTDPADTWRRVRAIASHAKVVKLSDEDVRTLCPGRPESECLEQLLASSPLVVVTRGAAGASAYTSEGSVDVAITPGPLVDTVGAGDSFMAALLAVLVEHDWSWERDDLAWILHAATTAAAVTCSRRGANPPRRRELPPGWPRG